MTDPAEDHLVHEAVGPPMTRLEAAGALGVGVNSLLGLGVMSVLLGALAAEHRLTVADIGNVSAIEVLAMGVATALTGILMKPRRLRLIGVAASLLLAAIDLSTARAEGIAIFALRAGAGVIEGVLLWITVAMISRTQTPERWAGVFFTAQTGSQLLLAIALAAWIMAAGGAAAGFVALAVCAVVGAGPALVGPSRLADLNPGEAIAGPPPFRGWIALVGTLVYVAGGGAVAVYLQPLAMEAGLDANVARTALWVSLAGQVAGGAAATAMAGRIRWQRVFLITSAASLIVWWLFGQRLPAWLFVGANALSGVTGIFLAPFLVPMTIEADPSRRAAVQSGAAQLLGAAAGPALAAMAVRGEDVHGVLWLAMGVMITGLAIVTWLHASHRPEPAPPA